MFDRKTLYALNKKDPDAIVYLDADRNMVRLTREDFSDEDEFQRWKAWSNADFHREEKGDHVYANHTSPLGELNHCDTFAPSAEDAIQAQEEQQEREALQAALMEGLEVCLTDAQRRRLWLHYVESKSLREISSQENANHGNIRKSIIAAQKNLKKFLKNGDTNPRFSGDK